MPSRNTGTSAGHSDAAAPSRGEDEFAYGPLLAFLRARFGEAGEAGCIEAPFAGAKDKRTLLEDVHRRLGESALLEAGRAAAQLDGHPFLAALLATSSPCALLACWCNLEVLGHTTNRIAVEAVMPCSAELRRVTTKGDAPSIAEDLFIMGILCGLLERLGATRVCASPSTLTRAASGRYWTLSWKHFSKTKTSPQRLTWLVGTDFARAVLGYLLNAIDEGADAPGLAEVAARLGLPARTLQRRFHTTQTSFRALLRAARVIRAGEAIVARSNASLTEVAHACGFADSAHMSREFKAIVAVPPSAFARSLARKRNLARTFKR